MRDYFMKTARLGFSVWNEADLPDAMALWGSPDVARFITATGCMTDEQVRERLQKEMENQQNHQMQYWPIFLLENGQNAGCCGLRPYDSVNHVLELGVHLQPKQHSLG